MNFTSDTFATQFTGVVLIILVLLFTMLIIYTYSHRWLLNYRKKKKDDAEEYILPLIYRYLDGEINASDFSDALRNHYDIVVAFNNIDEMIDSLKGEERERLKKLLDLSLFRTHFLKKLQSKAVMDLAKACMYSEKKIETDPEIIKKLYNLQHHDHPVIVYAATLALINTSEQEIRDYALISFLQSPQNASMAINDIIYKYCELHPSKDGAAKLLMEQVSSSQIPVKNAVATIRMFRNLNFYQLTEPLFELFCSPLPHDELGQLRATLLSVLNQLPARGIKTELFRQRLWESDYQVVRLETARWIYQHYTPDLNDMLVELCGDDDLEVRIAAQKTLLEHADISDPGDHIPAAFRQEWQEIKEIGDTHVNII
ncbi:MAG: HEAT repeat domain-containing protein [Balneolaceae bacterium]|nr:HEAT repeat domain-containing protein [Balneolaceae bacterium]